MHGLALQADANGGRSFKTGSFVNTPTSLAHSVFSESGQAVRLNVTESCATDDGAAVVDMKFKTVSGPVSEVVVVRRLQGDVIAYHEIFRQVRTMLSQETYGVLCSDRVQRMTNRDLGHHVKRLRASSVAERSTPRMAKRGRHGDGVMLMEGFYGMATRMLEGVPLKSR